MINIEYFELPLVSRLRSDDPTALYELYDAYAMALFSEVILVVRVQQVAEDILIETFAYLWANRSQESRHRETLFWTLLVQSRRLCQIHLAPHEDPDVSVLDWADDHESADEITRRLLDVEYDIPNNIRERLSEVINLTLPQSPTPSEGVVLSYPPWKSDFMKGLIVGLFIGIILSVWLYINREQFLRELDSAWNDLVEKDSVLNIENVDNRVRYNQLLSVTDNILGRNVVKIELTGTATSGRDPIHAFWNRSDSGVYIDTRELHLENAYQQLHLWAEDRKTVAFVGRIVVSGSRIPIIKVGNAIHPHRLFITLGSAYDKRDEPGTNIVASGIVHP